MKSDYFFQLLDAVYMFFFVLSGSVSTWLSQFSRRWRGHNVETKINPNHFWCRHQRWQPAMTVSQAHHYLPKTHKIPWVYDHNRRRGWKASKGGSAVLKSGGIRSQITWIHIDPCRSCFFGSHVFSYLVWFGLINSLEVRPTVLIGIRSD